MRQEKEGRRRENLRASLIGRVLAETGSQSACRAAAVGEGETRWRQKVLEG